MNAPELTTERLLIRRMVSEDAAAVHRYRSHPAVTRHQAWQPSSLEEVQSFIDKMADQEFNREGTWFQFALCPKGINELIGDLGLHFTGPQNLQVEIGYTISPAHQRQGFAFEAINCIMSYVFGNMNKHRVIATVDPGNLPSIALLTKLKMRKEAHFRKSMYLSGQWVDDVVYAVLKEEWTGNSLPSHASGAEPVR